MDKNRYYDAILKNLDEINSNIEKACLKANRKQSEITLVAISKTHPVELIETAYNAGLRQFGENRIQEAESKFDGFHSDAVLHLVGHIQSNKAKKAAVMAEWIHSVDKASTAEKLSKNAEQLNKTLQVLLEVNTTGKESQHGYRDKDNLYRDIEKIAGFPAINIRGLMTIAPFTNEEKYIRKSFSYLRNLLENVRRYYPNLQLDQLSMGMTNDYSIAVEEGATMLRIGSAIFGARDYI